MLSYMDGLLLALACVFLLFFRWHTTAGQALPLPPGPKWVEANWKQTYLGIACLNYTSRPKFLIGNVSDIPSSYMWIGFSKLAGQFGESKQRFKAQQIADGPPLRRHLPSQDLLDVYGSLKQVRDCHWTLGQTRCHVFFEAEICSWKRVVSFPWLYRINNQVDIHGIYRTKYNTWNFASMEYTPEFKAHRRLFETHFRASAIQKYHTQQMQSTARMLQNLLEDPKDFSQIIHMWVNPLNLLSL